MPFLQHAFDLASDADLLRRRPYGVIEARGGRLAAIHLRPWPKFVSLLDVVFGNWYHDHVPGDRVRLYYNQPRRFPNFLTLKYVISARGTTWATFRRALATLDEIARIKNSDALLCDAANFRISPRLLAREGWQPHTGSRWHRNYIKRFYGEYPRLHAESEADHALAMTA
jgi:hypothetical protein